MSIFSLTHQIQRITPEDLVLSEWVRYHQLTVIDQIQISPVWL